MSSLAARASTAARSTARDRVARGAAGSAVLNIAATAVNFAIAVLLTNTLGARGYGAFAFALAWSTVLAVPATLGQSQLIIRSITRYLVEGDWGRLRGMMRHSHLIAVGGSALIVAVAAAVGAVALAHRSQLLYPFLIALPLVPLMAVTTMRQSVMMGLGRVLLGRIPETLLAPGGFLALALGGVILFGHRFSASAAMASQVIAGVVAWAVGLVLLHRSLPGAARCVKPIYERRVWGISTAWLTGMSLASALNAQLAVIMLGALGTASQAGIYQAANRAALFVSFLFLASGYSVGPALARLRVEKLHQETQALLTGSVRVLFVLSVPVALAFIVFAPQLLEIFGGGFRGGATILRVLVIGELVRVGTGFAGPALVLAGYERDLVWIALAGVALTFALSLALIPALSAPGAAVAATIGLVVTQVAPAIVAWRRLSLSTAVIAPRRPGTLDRPATPTSR